MSEVIEIDYYPVNSDAKPYFVWFKSLDLELRIRKRLRRVRLGLFGVHDSIREGVWELKFHEGGAIRIYYGKSGNLLIVILCGGNKSTQNRDITKACEYWKNHQLEIRHDNKKRSNYQQEL